MARIFISYIHEEERIAKAVYELLKAVLSTKEIFMSSDKWQIFAGELWLERITKELGEAEVVVSLLSELSVTRPWVNFEAGAAWLTKKIIPACYGGLTKSTLPKPYSSIQALDLSEAPDLYYLVTSVSHHLKSLTLAPPPPLFPLFGSEIHESFEPYQAVIDSVASFETERLAAKVSKAGK